MPSRDSSDSATTLSSNMDGVGTSATLALLEMVQRRRSEGHAVLDLGLGEPVFPAPASGARGAIDSVRKGDLRYGPVAGTRTLRELVAADARALGTREADIRAEHVVISNGSKQALFNACFVLFGPGDDVLVPTPAWTSYYDIIRLSRARPVPVFGDATSSFKIDVDRLRAAASPNTRGLILNSPCNPTGAVYSREELADIVRLADERGWWIISDEIYRAFSYESEATSLLSVSDGFDRLVVTNGMSKAYAMPAWRIGWSIAPPDVTARIIALQSHATAGPGNAGQAAAVAILSNADESTSHLDSIRDAFRTRRDCALAALRAVDGLEIVEPQGAFYCFFRVRGESAEFCRRLLAAHDVAIIPGDAFGVAGWARASYSGELDSVREGFTRLSQFLRGETRD
jgi:aspartate aminotransferase